MTNYEIGITAECAAMRYLENNGYEIIKNRYKTKHGEIDIIAKIDKTIVFVEVKTRKNLLDSGESISEIQLLRIRNAASIYIQENENIQNEFTFRFDAILLCNSRLSHIENIL